MLTRVNATDKMRQMVGLDTWGHAARDAPYRATLLIESQLEFIWVLKWPWGPSRNVEPFFRELAHGWSGERRKTFPLAVYFSTLLRRASWTAIKWPFVYTVGETALLCFGSLYPAATALLATLTPPSGS